MFSLSASALINLSLSSSLSLIKSSSCESFPQHHPCQYFLYLNHLHYCSTSEVSSFSFIVSSTVSSNCLNFLQYLTLFSHLICVPKFLTLLKNLYLQDCYLYMNFQIVLVIEFVQHLNLEFQLEFLYKDLLELSN